MIEKFDGKAVYLDTAPLIYYLEENPVSFSFLDELFKKNERGDFRFYSSSIIITEVLTLPFKLGNKELVDRYEYFLNQSEFFHLINVNPVIAKRSAELRSEYGLKLPDAVHFATALEAKVDFFLTNDFGFNKIKGLKIITLPNV